MKENIENNFLKAKNEKNNTTNDEKFINENEYQKVIQTGGFSFKNRFKLFKDGFKNLWKSSFSLFCSYLFWLVFIVFFIGAFDYEYTYRWFNVNYKEFLQTQDLMDYVMSWQLLVVVSFMYNSQQLFITNNILKTEKLINNNLFIKFIKQLPLLIKTSIILGTFLFISLYIIGTIYSLMVKDYGDFTFEYFFSFKGLLFAIGILISLILIYFNMLASTLIYIAEGVNPFNINIFKKSYRSFIKVMKMFDLIILTLFWHIILFAVAMIFSIYGGFLLFDYLKEVYQINNAENIKQLTYLISLATAISFGIIQIFLNKARIRSIALMFLMTEEQDDYNERLTKPLKN